MSLLICCKHRKHIKTESFQCSLFHSDSQSIHILANGFVSRPLSVRFQSIWLRHWLQNWMTCNLSIFQIHQIHSNWSNVMRLIWWSQFEHEKHSVQIPITLQHRFSSGNSQQSTLRFNIWWTESFNCEYWWEKFFYILGVQFKVW